MRKLIFVNPAVFEIHAYQSCTLQINRGQDSIVAQDSRFLVRKAIRGLKNKRDRKMIRLRLKGRSQYEIAAILQMPRETVRDRLTRIHAALKAKLQKYMKKGDDYGQRI